MKKFLLLAFLAFMALGIFWANTNTMPDFLDEILYGLPLGDKVGHFLIYGILAYLLTWVMPFRRISIGRFSLPLGLVLAIGFATLEEFSQLFVERRTPGLLDLFSGYLGVYASTWIPCMRKSCPPDARVGEKDENSPACD